MYRSQNSPGMIGVYGRRVRLEVIHKRRSVQLNLYPLAVDQDVQLRPFIVFRRSFINVAHAIKRAGFVALAVITLAPVGIVNLDLEPLLRPPVGLERSVEVDAGLRSRGRHELRPELEVLKSRITNPSVVKEV